MRKVRKELVQCDKCGEEKEITYNPYNYGEHCIDGMWSINLGRAGYDSGLDGCDIEFDICDDCLVSFISTFKNKEDIYNSGSNLVYDIPEEE